MHLRPLAVFIVAAAAGCTAASGCTGIIGDGGDPDSNPKGDPTEPINPDVSGVGKSGVRRLTRGEYMRTVYDLLGQEIPEAFTYLPDDPSTPFDNDYRSQRASQALIEGAQQLAELVATRVVSDTAKRSSLVGCTPAAADDVACMRKFVTTFGRRVLRRPLDEADITAFVALQSFARDRGDFYEGVRVVLGAMLQHPEFLYRIEFGTPVPNRSGLYRLGSWEVATRLSFLLVGTTPDDALLDLAASRRLSTPEQRRAAGQALLGRPRAHEQIQKFHASWLGYAQLQAPTRELMTAMQTETTALVERVIFERKEPWVRLFDYGETFVDDALAKNYGLPPPGSAAPQWVSYGASGRKGLLSHGSFLSQGVKFGDTSPTQRGKLIRTRLMCQDIPPPPPNVKADEPPEKSSGKCKTDYYKAHSQSATCSSCHSQMDPIGFGLENYDGAGRYRTTEVGNADCTIPGDGELVGIGKFNGPAQLGELLVTSGRLESCLVQQLYRFASGRKTETDDDVVLDHLRTTLHQEGHFDELLLDLVSQEAFVYRREEQ